MFIDEDKRIPLYESLIKNNISTNFDSKPFKDGLFIRLGSAEVTRRGMKEEEMKLIASLIDGSFKGEDVKDEVEQLNRKFNKIHYSFD